MFKRKAIAPLGAPKGATGVPLDAPKGASRIITPLLAFFQNWKTRSSKMTLEDWVRLSRTFPALLENKQLGFSAQVAELGDSTCVLCKTTNGPLAPQAWRRVSDYQLPVCRMCYLDRHGLQIKSAPWFPLMFRTFAKKDDADLTGIMEFLDTRENKNHPMRLLAFYEHIIFKELLVNGFQYNPSHVSVLRAIAPQVALVLERVLPKLTLNTQEQMEEGVKHVVRTSSLFVYAKATNVL